MNKIPNRSPPEDPRLTFSTPYLNVRPEVKYVGDAICAKCHAHITETYVQHPMGRSLSSSKCGLPQELYGESAHNPFHSAGIAYKVTCRAGEAAHAESAVDASGSPVAGMSAPIALSIGSGQNGRAFLVEREGSLVASPICWYPKKKRWDLSPGYEKHNPHFGRPITPDCLFCHANGADHLPGTTNRYRATAELKPIGCERCHGPGELHVQVREKGERIAGTDVTIVNPSRLEHSLRESVCQQCHLQGQQRILRRGSHTFDFRPGLPLHLFVADFVKPPRESETKFVSSGEQMYASSCFQKSTAPNKLGCISCHDPHSVPPAARKVSFYRERCINCHKDTGCSLPFEDRLPRQKDDSCVACHMPLTGSSINHTTITDHRVLRNPHMSMEKNRYVPHEFSLNHFYQNVFPPPDVEVERDLGIALVQYADSLPSGEKLNAMVRKALAKLEAALSRDEDDLPAWEAKGNALWFLGRLNEAIEAYERILKADPLQEMTLYKAATLSLRLSRNDAAKSYAQRAITINPWRWEYHQVLARAHAQVHDWKASLLSCQEALKLNALEPGSNRHLVLCHLKLGEKAKAERAMEILHILHPTQTEELRRWYAQQSR